MKNSGTQITKIAAICVLTFATHAHASCGSTACSMNTNWDDHSASQPGLSLDLRYITSTADVLRSRNNKIAADTKFNGEVENLSTVNTLITAIADYTLDEHWGATLSVPYLSRTHSHNLGPYNINGVSAGVETFSAKSIGDIKIVGRYRFALNDSNGVGFKLGVKLNTGRKNFTLNTGVLPNEVTLQPGNGSTDLIVGGFWQNATPGTALSWFAQGLLQQSIASDPSFTPGYQINVDAGGRYAVNKALSALLQVNVQLNGQDSGSSAALTPSSSNSTGGQLISVTPGISVAITPGTNIYSLIQLPVYQFVNGEQLTASMGFTAGINHRF